MAPSEPDRITIHFDAGCHPNPGETGCWGFVIDAPHGREKKAGTIASTQGRPLTNNVCEWTALREALTHVDRYFDFNGGSYELLIRGDSQLVVNQLTGKWACNPPALKALRDECRDLLRDIALPWTAEWIPRDQNAEADALAGDAFRKATGRPLPSPQEIRAQFRRA